MLIHKKIKMVDLILANYQLLPVINRFGINIGFEEKNIEQICKQKNINIDFFLEIVNAFHDKNYFPDDYLQKFSLKLIIDYLSKTHDFIINVKLNAIEGLIDKLKDSYNDNNNQKISLISTFFYEYKSELINHIKDENNIVYPYILLLEKAFVYEKEDFLEQLKKYNYSIEKYAREHSDVEENLFDLKSIILNYLPDAHNNTISNHIIFDLFELEADLINHQRIEEKVLIPKVRNMEKNLLS